MAGAERQLRVDGQPGHAALAVDVQQRIAGLDIVEAADGEVDIIRHVVVDEGQFAAADCADAALGRRRRAVGRRWLAGPGEPRPLHRDPGDHDGTGALEAPRTLAVRAVPAWPPRAPPPPTPPP